MLRNISELQTQTPAGEEAANYKQTFSTLQSLLPTCYVNKHSS